MQADINREKKADGGHKIDLMIGGITDHLKKVVILIQYHLLPGPQPSAGNCQGPSDREGRGRVHTP